MKYRREYLPFKTKEGIKKKCVCVASLSDETASQEKKRLIAKAERIANTNGWKLL